MGGDMAATILAMVGLWPLHNRSPAARLIIWLLAVESIADLVNATVGRVRENALETPQGVTWLILNLYAPSLWVAVGMTVWQLGCATRVGSQMFTAEPTYIAAYPRTPAAGPLWTAKWR